MSEANPHLTDSEVKSLTQASMRRSQERRSGPEPLSRREIWTHRVAVLAVAAGLGIVGGKAATPKVESGVNAAANAVGNVVDDAGNVVDSIRGAADSAGADHNVPSTQAGINHEAQQQIQATKNANNAHEQLRP